MISEDTSKSHIRHIPAKLNLRDRAQAVVIAYETGLVTEPAEDKLVALRGSQSRSRRVT